MLAADWRHPDTPSSTTFSGLRPRTPHEQKAGKYDSSKWGFASRHCDYTLAGCILLGNRVMPLCIKELLQVLGQRGVTKIL